MSEIVSEKETGYAGPSFFAWCGIFLITALVLSGIAGAVYLVATLFGWKVAAWVFIPVVCALSAYQAFTEASAGPFTNAMNAAEWKTEAGFFVMPGYENWLSGSIDQTTGQPYNYD